MGNTPPQLRCRCCIDHLHLGSNIFFVFAIAFFCCFVIVFGSKLSNKGSCFTTHFSGIRHQPLKG